MGDHYPRVWKPVIAAVNGWAAGAGLYVLLSSTDIRIASAEHARFKFALLTQGWVGHGPGAALLAKQLRYIDAMKILLTDEPFDAAEALRIGLINEVVPHAQLMERAEKIARHICTMPPVAVRMMKEFVVRFGDLPTDQAWQIQNLINALLIQATTDGEEGRQAFNEKRPPNFTGALRHRGDAVGRALRGGRQAARRGLPQRRVLKNAVGLEQIAADRLRRHRREARRAVEGVEAERGDRRDAVAADQQRRVQPYQAIDQPGAQQRRGEAAAALDQQPGQPLARPARAARRQGRGRPPHPAPPR